MVTPILPMYNNRNIPGTPVFTHYTPAGQGYYPPPPPDGRGQINHSKESVTEMEKKMLRQDLRYNCKGSPSLTPTTEL